MTKNRQVATGGTIASLHELSPEPGTARLYGRAFIGALDTGSQPSKKFTKPGRAFVAKIKEWLKARRLAASPWAVARSILTKGSRLWRTGRTYSGVGRNETIAGVIDDVSLGSLRARLGTAARKNVTSEVLKELTGLQ